MLNADTSFPVVVLKAGGTGALGVIRSLGRLGVRVCAVDASTSIPSLKSRYCSGQFLWDIDHAPAAESLDFLRHVARRVGGQPLLLPTDYLSTLFVAENRQVLKEVFLFSAMPPERVELLGNKKQMHFACRKLGIPSPETAFPQSRGDILAFASFPIVLKPIDPRIPLRPPDERAVIVRNKQELLESYDRTAGVELMLQEYIPGGDDSVWMFNGYFNERSECLFGATGNKLRQFPAYAGVTSLGVCLKNEAVEKTTKELMKAVGYRGILDIGYRYDARDGKYKLFDANPRIGATSRLFVGANGIDVARAWYLDLTGQPVPSTEVTEGRKWLAEDKDLVTSLRYYRDGKLTFHQWISSFRGVEEVAYFSLDDFMPGLQRTWNLLGRISEQHSETRPRAVLVPAKPHETMVE
jgi:D-aspartate ligase